MCVQIDYLRRMCSPGWRRNHATKKVESFLDVWWAHAAPAVGSRFVVNRANTQRGQCTVISDVGQDRVLDNMLKQMPCMQITRDRLMEPMTLADVKLLVVEFEVEALIARGDEVPNAAAVSSRYRCQWQQQTH